MQCITSHHVTSRHIASHHITFHPVPPQVGHGIDWTEDCTVEHIATGSQAMTQGVAIGWRAMVVGGKVVKKRTDIVAALKARRDDASGANCDQCKFNARRDAGVTFDSSARHHPFPMSKTDVVSPRSRRVMTLACNGTCELNASPSVSDE